MLWRHAPCPVILCFGSLFSWVLCDSLCGTGFQPCKTGVKCEAGSTGVVSSPCLVEIGWGQGSKLSTSTARVSQGRQVQCQMRDPLLPYPFFPSCLRQLRNKLFSLAAVKGRITRNLPWKLQGQVFLCCLLNWGLPGCAGKGLRCVGSSADHTSWLGPALILYLQWQCSFPASFLLWNTLLLPGKASNTVLLLQVFGDTCRETKWDGGGGRTPLIWAKNYFSRKSGRVCELLCLSKVSP